MTGVFCSFQYIPASCSLSASRARVSTGRPLAESRLNRSGETVWSPKEGCNASRLVMVAGISRESAVLVFRSCATSKGKGVAGDVVRNGPPVGSVSELPSFFFSQRFSLPFRCSNASRQMWALHFLEAKAAQTQRSRSERLKRTAQRDSHKYAPNVNIRQCSTCVQPHRFDRYANAPLWLAQSRCECGLFRLVVPACCVERCS